MNSLLPSSFSPPPYTNAATVNTDTASNNTGSTKRRTYCYICRSRAAPTGREVGPYLIHGTQPDLVLICPCLNKAHPVCLKSYGNVYICNMCNYIYPVKYHIGLAQMVCLLCHILSLGSVIGLVFGLSQLGRALDELALGSEIGPKLDGDETWQDHEMLEIVEWLNLVHFATGVAGEALLGLVYIVGVCLVIGLDRTLFMISNILYINLERHKWWASDVAYMLYVCLCLFILGLTLGTYLLFFSWIWASLLHPIRKRILNIKPSNTVTTTITTNSHNTTNNNVNLSSPV